MSGRLVKGRRSARGDRLRALAPRVAVYAGVAILSLAGVRAVLRGGEAAVVVSRQTAPRDLGARAFAEGFARAWLAYDAARPQERERALAAYLSDELEREGGYSPRRGERSVTWTTVAGERVRGRRHTVTVTAQTSTGLVYLAVPVERDGRVSSPSPPTRRWSDLPRPTWRSSPRARTTSRTAGCAACASGRCATTSPATGAI